MISPILFRLKFSSTINCEDVDWFHTFHWNFWNPTRLPPYEKSCYSISMFLPPPFSPHKSLRSVKCEILSYTLFNWEHNWPVFLGSAEWDPPLPLLLYLESSPPNPVNDIRILHTCKSRFTDSIITGTHSKTSK